MIKAENSTREVLGIRQPVDWVYLEEHRLISLTHCVLFPPPTVLSENLYSETVRAADGSCHVKGHFNSRGDTCSV